MASTPTLPRGIQSVVSAAQREGSALREKLSRSVANLELGDIADFDLLPLRTSSTPPPGGKRRSLRPGRRVQMGASKSQLETPSFGQTLRGTEASRPSEPSRKSEPVLRAPEPVAALRSEPIPLTRPESALRPEQALRSDSAPRSEPVPRLAQPERHGHSESVLRPVGGADPFARNGLRPVGQSRPQSAPAPMAQPVDDGHDPTSDVGDRSEPETYDRLVDAFLNTDSESIRRRIATRLHSSRNSDHPLARFYANRAIERLVDAGEEAALESVMSQIGAE
jgi:hypothetical protein